MVEPGIGGFSKHGLGAIGDAETSFLDHHAVVRAVADGQHLRWIESEFLAQRDKARALGHSIDDWVTNEAGELASLGSQAIGLHAVEADHFGDGFGERSEPARDQKARRAVRAHRPDQSRGTRIGRNAFCEAGCDRAFVEIPEQRNALAQRARKIEFALHRALRNLGDAAFQAGKIGELVDTFLSDDGRIHVCHQRFLPPMGLALHDHVNVSELALKKAAHPGDIAIDRNIGRRPVLDPSPFACLQPNRRKQANGIGNVIPREPIRC